MKVGQKVWYIPQRGSYGKEDPGRELVVSKVGRQWIYLVEADGHNFWWSVKIDKNQPNTHDGYWVRSATRGNEYNIGTVYLDKQNYSYCTLRKELWSRLTHALLHHPHPPEGLTLLAIRGILHSLGISDEPVSTKN